MMDEFFQLWRRKIGVVGLVAACLFTGLWVRGLFIEDTFDSPRWISTQHGIRLENMENSTKVWKKRYGGRELVADIPHWTAVPLTLLSAYLLLSKPRKTKPIAPTHPAPSSHA